LVVDDNPDHLNLLKKILSLAGYTVRPVLSGKLALRAVESTLPDLILLDIMMPQMDGYEFCSLLKASVRTKDIPVIFLSALHQVLDKVKAFEVGGVDYITKPFQMEEVVARVENQLRIHRLSQQLLEQNARLFEEICIRKQTEKKLKDSEKRFRQLFEGSVDGIVIVDIEGKIIDCNASYQKMLGYSLEELKSLKCCEITPVRWHEWDAEIVEKQVRERGYSDTFQKEYIRKDGTVFPVEVTTYCQRNDFGQLEIMWAVVRDISERKLAEKERTQLITSLKKREAALKSAQRVAHVGSWEFDVLTQKITWSEQLYCIFGLDPTEPEPTYAELIELIHPDDRELFQQATEHALATGTIYDLDFRIVRSDGQVRYLGGRGEVIVNQSGQVIQLFGTALDITSRKLVEEALRQSAATNRALLNAIPDMIFRCHADGTYIDFKPAKDIKTIVPPSVFIGKKVQEVLPPQMQQRILQAQEQALLSGETQIVEYQLTIDDQLHDYEARIVACGCDEIIAIVRDISDRKQAEKQLQLQAAAIAAATDGIAILNANGEYVYLNEAHVKIYGYDTTPELLGKSWQVLYDEAELRRLADEAMPELLQQGYCRTEALGKRRDGTTFPQEVSVTLLAGGEKICIVRDSTDRKRVEEALWESVQRERAIATAIQRMRQTLDIQTIFSATTNELRQLINCDRVGVYRFNPDWSGEFVSESVGSEWISLVQEQTNNPNLTQKTLEDKHCTVTSFNSEADKDSALSASSRVQDTYLQQTQGGAYSRGASHTAVEDIYKAGFNACYINLLERFQARAYIIVPIFLGTKLWGLLAIYQNSGSRQWKATEMNVVLQIGNQLGVALQQAELFGQTQRQSEALQLSEARFREKAQELELTLEDLKRTQAQLIQTEKMSSLGQMVAGVAHEINNPVSFIYGNLTPARDYFQDLLRLVELYQQTYPDSTLQIQQVVEEIDLEFIVRDWQQMMESMQIGAERIKEIVRSLLLFSRQNESELKPVDIHEGIESTLLILHPRLRAQANRPEIKVIKHYGQLPLITCYASQLNQVFMNLLSNAIDALEQEPVEASLVDAQGTHKDHPYTNQESEVLPTITICTEVKNPESSLHSDSCLLNASTVVIRIADNGPGMSEEVRHKIFDPFFTTKPVGNGTGLGLSISYQIVVENHNGHISCISAPGQGAEFIVEIPVNCKATEIN
jgi:PAS domain S-box-containing protein